MCLIAFRMTTMWGKVIYFSRAADQSIICGYKRKKHIFFSQKMGFHLSECINNQAKGFPAFPTFKVCFTFRNDFMISSQLLCWKTPFNICKQLKQSFRVRCGWLQGVGRMRQQSELQFMPFCYCTHWFAAWWACSLVNKLGAYLEKQLSHAQVFI